MIKEIYLRDFPWDELPWAVDENGSRYIPGMVTPEASVLLLQENNEIVAYLVYDVWSKAGYVEIHYVQVHISCQKKGYGTQLVMWVCDKYGSQYDLQAYSTSGIAERLLKKCGLERTCMGNFKRVRRNDT